MNVPTRKGTLFDVYPGYPYLYDRDKLPFDILPNAEMPPDMPSKYVSHIPDEVRQIMKEDIGVPPPPDDDGTIYMVYGYIVTIDQYMELLNWYKEEKLLFSTGMEDFDTFLTHTALYGTSMSAIVDTELGQAICYTLVSNFIGPQWYYAAQARILKMLTAVRPEVKPQWYPMLIDFENTIE